MAQPLRIVHDVDPKQQIMDETDPILHDWQIPPSYVLVVMYERSKTARGDIKSKGGIIIPKGPQMSSDEDKYQGKAGLLMKKGLVAFEDDDDHKWHGFKPAVGDWVVFSVGDSFSFDIPGERRCRVVHESAVKLIVTEPDLVW